MTQRANDFLIWRTGKPTGWDCTAQDIAADTGLSVATIKATCRRRGWKLTHGNARWNDVDRPSLVSIMSNPYAGMQL
jgi:hypothetical protein